MITAATVGAVFGELPPTTERFDATLADLDDRMMADGMAFGLLQHGSDVIMVEPNGYQANLPEVIGPVAAGKTVATFYRGGHGVTAFRWYSDGELVVDIEPGIPVPPTELPPDLYTDMQNIARPLHLRVSCAVTEWSKLKMDAVLDRLSLGHVNKHQRGSPLGSDDHDSSVGVAVAVRIRVVPVAEKVFPESRNRAPVMAIKIDRIHRNAHQSSIGETCADF